MSVANSASKVASTNSFEDCCCLCIYLPPSIDRVSLEKFYEYYFYSCYDKVSSESPETGFIVARDFNPCSNCFDMKCLSDYCDFNLKQVVKDPTRNSDILDLIFTNMHELTL